MCKCKRCNAVMPDKAFDSHVCKGFRNIGLMPSDLLLQIIGNKITEAEAWVLYDERIKS